MLILHVAAPSDVGGLERVVQGLAREQRRAGHDVHVAAILIKLGAANRTDAIAIAMRQGLVLV